MLRTARLTLRPWRDDDGDAFAALNADPVVMRDLGGPYSRPQSDAKLDRYRKVHASAGFSRLALETHDGRFIGYAGLMPVRPDHALGPHVDVGWRLHQAAWGQGYATEAARALLADGFQRLRLPQILAWTAADNLRSQAVMQRLGMARRPDLDFDETNELGSWHGLVWMASPSHA